jgi:hypothetical protein
MATDGFTLIRRTEAANLQHKKASQPVSMRRILCLFRAFEINIIIIDLHIQFSLFLKTILHMLHFHQTVPDGIVNIEGNMWS